MEPKTLSRFREALQLHKDSLLGWLMRKSPDVSRQLGGEMGTHPDEERVDKQWVVHKIEQALGQIENGEFGKCTLCEGEVEVERLALDFTTSVCLAHYTEAQIRDHQVHHLDSGCHRCRKPDAILLQCRTPSAPLAEKQLRGI